MIVSHPTKLAGVKLVKGLDIFHDHRGIYREIYSRQEYSEALGVKFVSHTMSRSHRGVLRGIHGDTRTWKLISCIAGSFYLVVVNCAPESNQFHQWDAFTLTDQDNTQVLVPAGFGNGHLVLADGTIFNYLQSEYYQGVESQFTLKWDDPKLKIKWPIEEHPILSERDRDAAYVK